MFTTKYHANGNCIDIYPVYPNTELMPHMIETRRDCRTEQFPTAGAALRAAEKMGYNLDVKPIFPVTTTADDLQAIAEREQDMIEAENE